MAYADIESRFFRLAQAISRTVPDRVKIGAVLTKNRKILSVGFNRMDKTHTAMDRLGCKKRLHAELSAVIGVRWSDVQGAVLFLYRTMRNGKLGMSRPCCHCQIILRNAGIRRVYYTDPSHPNSVDFMDIRGR